MQLPLSSRLFIVMASLFAATAVGLGAYASHGLTTWATNKQVDYVFLASQYQLFHALALLAVSILSIHYPSRLLQVCKSCFCLGILCFSGSLYYLVFTGTKLLVMLTPLGGVLLIIGWILLALTILLNRK